MGFSYSVEEQQISTGVEHLKVEFQFLAWPQLPLQRKLKKLSLKANKKELEKNRTRLPLLSTSDADHLESQTGSLTDIITQFC